MSRRSPVEAHLVLADGSIFEGEAIGAAAPDGVATGEVVFNTVLSGYQEVITDPSYAGQIITFTYPHIGNYGVNDDDNESRRPFCGGVVVRDLARRHSNWRAGGDLDSMLVAHGVAGIAGVDTRRLTRHLRNEGAMPGAFGTADQATLTAAAASAVSTDGVDMVAGVTCEQAYTVASTGGGRRIVAYDLGIKGTILRHLSALGEVTVVPASTTAADVLAMAPDGVFQATPNRSNTSARRSANCWTRFRCSASASATRSWPEPSAARPSSFRSGTTAATIRSATWSPVLLR